MIVLTDILAVSDAMKNVAAFATGHFTVAGVLDTIADVAVVASQLEVLLATMDRFQGGLLVGSAVLYKTIAVVAVVETANGFGRPDTGTAFTSGASDFDEVGESLRHADPDPSRWSGSAAGAYAARNDDQQGFAAQVADLDRKMAALLELQAGQVDKVREGLAGVKLTLAAAAVVLGGIIAASAASGDLSGVGAKKYVNAVCTAALLTVLGLLLYEVIESADHATSAEDMTSGYEKVAAAAEAASQAPGAPIVVPPPASSAPPAAPAAGPAPAATPAPAASGASSTAEQLAQAMGLGMQMEPALAQAATQGMQSVQQFAQMAAQAGGSGRHAQVPGGPAAPPAPAEPDVHGAPAGGPEPAAAASGAPAGAGRVPVDARVDTTASGPAPAGPAESTL